MFPFQALIISEVQNEENNEENGENTGHFALQSTPTLSIITLIV